MSSTPKTDSEVFRPDGVWTDEVVYASFARALERVARDLYLSDHWVGTKLPHSEQAAKWETLRVLLGIEHGRSPKPEEKEAGNDPAND